MDNNQLLYELREINSITNDLDRIAALQKFSKKYKKSDFYKATRMPLEKLQAKLLGFRFEEFVANFLVNFNLTNLSNSINQVLNGLDSETVSNFFNQITQALDIQDLTNVATTLQEQMKQMRQ